MSRLDLVTAGLKEGERIGFEERSQPTFELHCWRRRCHINRLRRSEVNSADRDQAATLAMVFHCAIASRR
jgi:hypothetical protein